MAKTTFKIVHAAVGRLLVPLVRFCLRHSLKYQDLLELLKRSFVEIAVQELSKISSETSISRISAITGIQRREVAKLVASKSSVPTADNMISRVVAQWRHDPRFQASRQTPRVLSAGKKQSEFSALVQSVNKDLNPYTVLFELERLGYVEHAKNGLRLKARLHDTAIDPAKSLALLADDLNDLIEAVNQNIFNRASVPNLHLRTEYDRIPDEDLPEIRAWMLREGTRFHEMVSSYLADFDVDLNPRHANTSSHSRVVLGSYSWAAISQQSNTSTEEIV